MEDVNQLQVINNALKSENASLKDAIAFLEAQKNALDQTVKEILTANINFKASLALLEKKHANAMFDNNTLTKNIEDLKREKASQEE